MNGGFTLIELLVVVAIITILAGIAVPNFLEAQTRAKVSRIKNDQRVLATALETYMLDHNRYPPRYKYPNPDESGRTVLRGLGDVERRAEDMRVLTTPVSYLSSLPVDIFETHVAPPNNIIDYYEPVLVHLAGNRWSSGSEYRRGKQASFWGGWGLMSVGPDRVLGTTNTMGNYPVRTSAVHYWLTYDPTNGTISTGNIYRFQKNGAIAEDVFNVP